MNDVSSEYLARFDLVVRAIHRLLVKKSDQVDALSIADLPREFHRHFEVPLQWEKLLGERYTTDDVICFLSSFKSLFVVADQSIYPVPVTSPKDFFPTVTNRNVYMRVLYRRSQGVYQSSTKPVAPPAREEDIYDPFAGVPNKNAAAEAGKIDDPAPQLSKTTPKAAMRKKTPLPVSTHNQHGAPPVPPVRQDAVVTPAVSSRPDGVNVGASEGTEAGDKSDAVSSATEAPDDGDVEAANAEEAEGGRMKEEVKEGEEQKSGEVEDKEATGMTQAEGKKTEDEKEEGEKAGEWGNEWDHVGKGWPGDTHSEGEKGTPWCKVEEGESGGKGHKSDWLSWGANGGVVSKSAGYQQKGRKSQEGNGPRATGWIFDEYWGWYWFEAPMNEVESTSKQQEQRHDAAQHESSEPQRGTKLQTKLEPPDRMPAPRADSPPAEGRRPPHLAGSRDPELQDSRVAEQVPISRDTCNASADSRQVGPSSTPDTTRGRSWAAFLKPIPGKAHTKPGQTTVKRDASAKGDAAEDVPPWKKIRAAADMSANDGAEPPPWKKIRMAEATSHSNTAATPPAAPLVFNARSKEGVPKSSIATPPATPLGFNARTVYSTPRVNIVTSPAAIVTNARVASLSVGDIAQVKVLNGACEGEFLDCRILKTMPATNKYVILTLPTPGFPPSMNKQFNKECTVDGVYLQLPPGAASLTDATQSADAGASKDYTDDGATAKMVDSAAKAAEGRFRQGVAKGAESARAKRVDSAAKGAEGRFRQGVAKGAEGAWRGDWNARTQTGDKVNNSAWDSDWPSNSQPSSPRTPCPHERLLEQQNAHDKKNTDKNAGSKAEWWKQRSAVLGDEQPADDDSSRRARHSLHHSERQPDGSRDDASNSTWDKHNEHWTERQCWGSSAPSTSGGKYAHGKNMVSASSMGDKNKERGAYLGKGYERANENTVRTHDGAPSAASSRGDGKENRNSAERHGSEARKGAHREQEGNHARSSSAASAQSNPKGADGSYRDRGHEADETSGAYEQEGNHARSSSAASAQSNPKGADGSYRDRGHEADETCGAYEQEGNHARPSSAASARGNPKGADGIYRDTRYEADATWGNPKDADGSYRGGGYEAEATSGDAYSKQGGKETLSSAAAACTWSNSEAAAYGTYRGGGYQADATSGDPEGAADGTYRAEGYVADVTSGDPEGAAEGTYRGGGYEADATSGDPEGAAEGTYRGGGYEADATSDDPEGAADGTYRGGGYEADATSGDPEGAADGTYRGGGYEADATSRNPKGDAEGIYQGRRYETGTNGAYSRQRENVPQPSSSSKENSPTGASQEYGRNGSPMAPVIKAPRTPAHRTRQPGSSRQQRQGDDRYTNNVSQSPCMTGANDVQDTSRRSHVPPVERRARLVSPQPRVAVKEEPLESKSWARSIMEDAAIRHPAESVSRRVSDQPRVQDADFENMPVDVHRVPARDNAGADEETQRRQLEEQQLREEKRRQLEEQRLREEKRRQLEEQQLREEKQERQQRLREEQRQQELERREKQTREEEKRRRRALEQQEHQQRLEDERHARLLEEEQQPAQRQSQMDHHMEITAMEEKLAHEEYTSGDVVEVLHNEQWFEARVIQMRNGFYDVFVKKTPASAECDIGGRLMNRVSGDGIRYFFCVEDLVYVRIIQGEFKGRLLNAKVLDVTPDGYTIYVMETPNFPPSVAQNFGKTLMQVERSFLVPRRTSADVPRSEGTPTSIQQPAVNNTDEAIPEAPSRPTVPDVAPVVAATPLTYSPEQATAFYAYHFAAAAVGISFDDIPTATPVAVTPVTVPAVPSSAAPYQSGEYNPHNPYTMYAPPPPPPEESAPPPPPPRTEVIPPPPAEYRDVPPPLPPMSDDRPPPPPPNDAPPPVSRPGRRTARGKNMGRV